MGKDIDPYEIDGINFVTQEFDYDVGAPIFWKLFKMCGKSMMSFLFEGVSGIIEDLTSGEMTKDEMAGLSVMEIFHKLDKKKVVEAADYFLQNVDPQEMLPLQQKILKTTWIVDESKNRREINWKLDFKGKYATAFKVLKKVLLFQFSSVFQNVLSGIAEQNRTVTEVVGKTVVAK